MTDQPDPPRPSLAEVAARLEAQAEAGSSNPAGDQQPLPPAAKSPEPPGHAGAAAEAGETPRATRRRSGAILGGVCSGLAGHLRLPVLVLRIAFVVLGAFELVGGFIYAALWLLLPLARDERAPGLDAASRTGMRAETREVGIDIGSVLALALLGLGLTWLFRSTGISWTGAGYWPLLVGSSGVALIWRQADDATLRPGRRRSLIRLLELAFGGCLVLAAVVLGVTQVLGIAQWRSVVWVSMVAVVGVLGVSLPWAFRTRTALTEAREQELLANARADVAAHLHDSVLQSLALIQRQADDPKAVATIARRQERELRSWLYGEAETEAGNLRATLTAAIAEVEDEHAVPVDVVVVGDAEMTPQLDALVRAAREAVLNATKHSGADRIDVYAEVTPHLAEVFIRDRGVGFEVDTIGEDRMGIRRSIMDRMIRNGGTARVRSVPGDGTEVRLEMELE